MVMKFQDDFFWMLRESKGYYPWVKDDSYRLVRLFERYFGFYDHPFHHYRPEADNLVRLLLSKSFFENEIIDLFFKSLIRAEIRFISRYIPQRSNEERLTGNIVSEIDNSIYLVSDECEKFSMKRYNEKKYIDFIYTDMSRGGRVEKETGADLGFILVLDLPDYPYTVKTLILQAKKIYGSASIDRKQYEIMTKICEDHSNCAYLFYDTNLESLTSPMVLKTENSAFVNKYDECKKNGNDSFSLNYEHIYSGLPLSLFIVICLLSDSCSMTHRSFEEAMEYFTDVIPYRPNDPDHRFNGRLGIVSLGKKIQYHINSQEKGGLDIFIK